MTHPYRWFLPIYVLLASLVFTVAWGQHTSAKSAKQKDTLTAVSLLKRAILPDGDINRASVAQTHGLVQILLYCQKNDIDSALGKVVADPACAGVAPPAQAEPPSKP